MATKKSPRTPKVKKSAGAEALAKQRRKSPTAAPKDDRTSVTTETVPDEGGKFSALDAAALVLAASSEPMNCQEMIAVMAEKGLWTSPAGKTPAATLYSGIL